MRNVQRRSGKGWWLLMVLVLVSFVVFGVKLGPHRTVMISAASFLSTAFDGLAEQPGPDRLRVLDLRIDPAHLDSLERDLPWSGGTNFPAMLVQEGVQYPVKFRYRGTYSASHFLGGKKSFRLSLKKKNPFAPYRKLNVINPKSFNMVNNHLGLWIAGRMGVPVPWNEMVSVHINDREVGVMELYEQIGGDFESIRGLARKQVPVYKGDYAPIEDRALPPKRTLWRKAEHWEYVSKADTSRSQPKLRALVKAIDDSTLTIAQRRDTLEQLIDVDAYARYYAAMLVVNTKHMDQYHNQWLVLSERSGLFYPVFWDALLMFPPKDEPLYFINDALAHWFLRIPEWRLLRDRYAMDAMRELHGSGDFIREYDRTIAEIRPSVLRDRNKYGHVTLNTADVHRFSLLHTISSFAGMRATVNKYWDRLTTRLSTNAVTVDRGEKWRIRSTSEAPLRLSWPQGEQTDPPTLNVAGVPTMAVRNGKDWSVVMHRTLGLPEGSWDRPFANWQHYIVRPLDVTVEFPSGIPAGLVLTNAITDEAIR